jgi:NAD(P)H-dependent FMN reductase
MATDDCRVKEHRMTRPRIGIIVGTTRQGRFADKPAQWIASIVQERSDLSVETIDLRNYPLPLFDEPISPARGSAKNPIAERWNDRIAACDGYIFITAEYNHGISGAVKNALDHSYREFNRKPAAFVAYGGLGGARAVEQLRLICLELEMASVRSGVFITREPYAAVLGGGRGLSDFDFLTSAAATMLDELAWWTSTLKAGRSTDTIKLTP